MNKENMNETPVWKRVSVEKEGKLAENSMCLCMIHTKTIGVLALTEQALRIGDYYISIRDLMKLPKED